eukprot:TRINITY_DN2658_c0_g1_i1.p1 TRINITY_DN2658_c0_g1~~TRINITY_DN2658_c0_g1_i1.p1  ORF type:complete len:738 (+),score=129.91 TRINITY_DN2658_c0_g1_i1:92-2305(+)
MAAEYQEADTIAPQILAAIRRSAHEHDLNAITSIKLQMPLAYLHPVFGRLINLQSLTLNNGMITRIENISTLTDLRTLDLSNNRITDIGDLSAHSRLESLTLDFNTSITILKQESFVNCPRLHTLSLRGCGVSNLRNTTAVLKQMPSLCNISFQYNGTGIKLPQARHPILAEPLLPAADAADANVNHAIEDDDDDASWIDEDSDEAQDEDAHDDDCTEDDNEGDEEDEGDEEGDEDHAVHGARRDIRDYVERYQRRRVHQEIPPQDQEWMEADGAHEARMRVRLHHLVQRLQRDFNDGAADVVADLPDPDDVENTDDDAETVEALASQRRSKICVEPHYRAWLIANLPQLLTIDGVPISEQERVQAPVVIAALCEPNAYGFEHHPPLLEVLHQRALGVRAFSRVSRCKRPLTAARCRMTAQFSQKALCAARIGTYSEPFREKPRSRLAELVFDCNLFGSPRQLEFSPHNQEYVVVGTTTGRVTVVNHNSSKPIASTATQGNIVLGLCWMHNTPGRFVAGSENGQLDMFDVETMKQQRTTPVTSFQSFPHLTSVHVNCTDQYMLASGYSRNVHLYDVPTGRVIDTLSGIHRQHINVLKFANHNPNIFCTSSFDCSVKMWDLRQRDRPVFEQKSQRGCVMMCFSPDDRYVLSSAVDNEVRQYLLDGTAVLRYTLPTTGSISNYTRAYFMNGSDYVMVGSCEESVVRVCCAKTGRLLSDVEFAHQGFGPDLNRGVAMPCM